MNNASRKVKNPLLSAAGPGFPFDNYTENTLLVPVNPASAMLRDDAELDNFIGQEPANIQFQSPLKTQENFPSDTAFQSKENKDTVNQSAKSGYFTTILSSLPNLSLSSVKNDALGSQINQTIDNTSSGVIHEPNPYISSQGQHGSQSEIPGFLAINSQNPQSTNLSGFAAFGPTDTVSNPPQPAAPPNLPQPGYAPISYRLGNQRRLKYAPPPDLTTNAKPSPTVQTFFPTQNVSASPTILNPFKSEGSVQDNNSSVQQISSLPEQLPKFEPPTGNSSLHTSFRSNLVTTETTYNSSIAPTTQNQFSESSSLSTPSQFVSSLSKPIPTQILEPATPQNTPANISFPGFTPYVNRDILPTSNSSNLDKEVAAFKNPNQQKSTPEFSRDSIPETTTESTHKSPLITEETKAIFTPISAAKVTEKLEHLLAEQKGDFPSTTPETFSKIDEITSSVTTESTKSFEPQSETPLATNEFIDESYKAKLNDVQEKIAQPGSDTWSDVFLGQEPAAESVICPKVHTADNNSVVTDNQVAELSTHLPQEYFQLQSTSMPSSFYADRPADQRSSLNYIPPVQLPQNNFYNPPKPTEQSASVFFESTKPDGFSNFYQEKNINSSLGQPSTLIVATTNNPQQVQENLTFNSTAANSTIHAPFWNADQSSQSQVLNTISNQPVCTATSQSLAPTFYNPAQFTNELSKQRTFSHTYSQQSSQQQSYQNPSSYENNSGLQSYAAHEDNTSYSALPAVSMVTAIPEPTGSATLNPIQISVNAPLINRTTPDTIPPSFQNLAAASSDKHMQYRPVYQHWFYRKEVENKTLWFPFSMQDSLKLEEIHNSTDITPETTVATEGGRYDVDILRRQRVPVYWTGASTEVRRCSWFFKGASESRYVPYNESTAVKLEEEYKQACLTNNWNRRIDLNNGEYVIFHSATVQVHYLQPTSPDLAVSWGNSAGSEDSTYLQGSASRPRVVKRGVDEFNIEEGEPEKVDHLLFVVHGIGSVCDLKFRTVEEVVNEFRSISLQLVQSHYRTASEQGIVNRIEVLPISWHTTLHSEDTGIDKKLQSITLESIPKLRHFTNDTLLDILFYTSPVYCQTIMRTVGSEINRLHFLFKERNPTFDGEIYLGGHSLGSLILFDLLCHQNPVKKEEEENEKNNDNTDDNSDREGENDSIRPIKRMPAAVLKRHQSRRISYVVTGAAGTGQPYIHYPQLNFHPRAFFALGSPIGMFVTVRGIDTLGEDFALPTCPAFFNIFHPFDPVAYRVESLINPEAHKFRPMLIPHHKGRKRMHLELKETMARVGADLKQKLIDSVKHTWNSFYQLALFHKPDNQALEREIDKVVEEQLQKQPSVPDQHNNDDDGANLKIGNLNRGRRIDYVLQEAPFEYINEYIFALTSHICYWESEDTILLILKEIYGSKGIQTDAQLPQQTLSIERMSPSPSLNLATALSNNESNAEASVMGVDPTVSISSRSVGPPPKTGFVPKS